MAAPTPAADAGGVVALFATGDIVAYDRDGNLQWYRSLARDYPGITNNVGMASSPILHQNVVLIPLENAGNSFAAALDRATGATLWKVERHKDINWVTPLVVANGSQADVLFQTGKEITAYDLRTGKKRWTHEAGLSSVSSPVLGDGQILIPGGEFTVLKAHGDSSAPEVVWKSNKIKTSYPSPVYYKGRVYTLNSASILSCNDAADGASVWQQRLKGKFWASPIIADGKLYAVNEEGTTFVVDLGASDDQNRILAENKLEDTFLATPAIAKGALFLRSDGWLYCIGAK
jgi:outer membrane protein assembly factor BamB